MTRWRVVGADVGTWSHTGPESTHTLQSARAVGAQPPPHERGPRTEERRQPVSADDARSTPTRMSRRGASEGAPDRTRVRSGPRDASQARAEHWSAVLYLFIAGCRRALRDAASRLL
ncbi:hypothetical protein BC834DRAFT_516832 [Gloeopeniophorella convolvens]|nr:hypothetical protein BC834DRAFT_516832 [Gloeopeniophorella convolvens]